MIKSYKDLLAWQKSMDLVELIYAITQGFPREELFGLSTSLRRAAVSAPSKIAAGHERDNTRDYIQHLASACGSISEVETQVEIARRLGYINEEQQERVNKLASDAGKIINGLIKSMERHAAAY